MSQKSKILSLLKASPEGVSCRVFEAEGHLYHKLSSRISDLAKEGYTIIRQESHTESPMDARYKLIDSPQDNQISSVKGSNSLKLPQEAMELPFAVESKPSPIKSDISLEVGSW